MAIHELFLQVKFTHNQLPDGWKQAEGPTGAENYCFQYLVQATNGQFIPCETIALQPSDFHEQEKYKKFTITINLEPQEGLTAKFRWLNARANDATGNSTRGQRFTMLEWQEQRVVFAVDQKLDAATQSVHIDSIDLDVWLGGLGAMLGEEELCINCDPKIEIQQ